jgi:hypothetical protein
VCEMSLTFDQKAEVCSVIMDTGFVGNAEDYVQQFYNKPFDELTTCEAEMLIRTLGNKAGCLHETEEGNYERKEA